MLSWDVICWISEVLVKLGVSRCCIESIVSTLS